MPAPHHSIFYRPDALPDAQPTVSKLGKDFMLFMTVISIVLNLATTTTTVLWPFFRDHLGEPVPEENFWTLWC